MLEKLDPRLWNLFAGILIGAGCGARVAGEGASDGATPECVDDSDCGGTYYYCDSGVCGYVPHHDGSWAHEYDYDDYGDGDGDVGPCYSDLDCDEFELCVYANCQLQGAPPPACEAPSSALPIPNPGPGLALTFADVDGDGQAELIVATETSLVVHETQGGAPIVTPREPGEIAAMVAGQFDAAAGVDVLVLVGEELRQYSSNGDGSFATAVTSMTPIGLVHGLISAEFDAEPPTDLLGWGEAGSYLSLGPEVSWTTDQPVDTAATFQVGASAPGLALRRASAIELYDLAGQPTGATSSLVGPSSVAAFEWGGGSGYVTTITESSWSRVLVIDPVIGEWLIDWLIHGVPEQVLTGDLDGDGTDELVFNFPNGVAIEFDPGGPGDCWDVPSVMREGIGRAAAFGDHDGDGDLELAILTSTGGVALLDGG